MIAGATTGAGAYASGPAAVDFDDHLFALELLETEGVLVVPGSSFNLRRGSTHFRVTLLPEAEQIRDVFARIDTVLGRYAARAKPKAAVA